MVEKARLLEKVIDSWKKKSKIGWERGVWTNNSSQTTNVVSHRNKLFEARKAQGLCYRCGEKYFVGHQCKPKQPNAMAADVEPPEQEQGEFTNYKIEEKENILLQEGEVMDKAISLNDLLGGENVKYHPTEGRV